MRTKNTAIVKDLTNGSITRNLIIFSFPFILSNLLQTVYNMVDMIVVGNVIGSTGLVAVSGGGDLMNLGLVLSNGFTMAGQILVSQYVGAGKKEELQRFIGTLFSVVLLLGLFASVVGIVLCDWFLDLLNVPLEALAEARMYSLCCFCGMVFIFGYNLVAAILRGMGASKHPFFFIAIATIMNLCLDLLFVVVFQMGAFGAAFATVLSQAFSFLASLVFLYRRRESFSFDFQLRRFRIDGDDLKALLKLGIPMALQNSVITISILVVNSYVNSYGLAVSAISGVGAKLNNIILVVTGAISTSASSVIGQCFGAGKLKKIATCVYSATIIGLIYTGILSVVLAIWPEQVFGLFNSDSAVLALAREYSLVVILGFFGVALRGPFNALINGVGNAPLAATVGIVDGFVCRIGLAILMGVVLGMGIHGFWYGNVLAGFVPFLIGGTYFWSGLWKRRKFMKNERKEGCAAENSQA